MLNQKMRSMTHPCQKIPKKSSKISIGILNLPNLNLHPFNLIYYFSSFAINPILLLNTFKSINLISILKHSEVTSAFLCPKLYLIRDPLLTIAKKYLPWFYNPILNELFFAEKGAKALLNNKPIRVSSRKTLAKSILSQSFDYSNEKRKDNFRNIQKTFFQIEGFRLYHSTELELCNVACGRTEGYMVSSSNPWDIAAGAFIVERAGGKVTNFDGTKWSYQVPRIVATNKRIHKELLQVLSNKER